MEAVVVAGVTATKDEAKITLHGISDKPGIQAQVFKPLADAGIVVDVIVQAYVQDGRTNLTFTLAASDLPSRAGRARQALRRRVRRRSDQERVGAVRRSRSWASACARTRASALKMFEVFAKENVHVHLISTSENQDLVRHRRKYAELAVRALHDGFELGKA